MASIRSNGAREWDAHTIPSPIREHGCLYLTFPSGQKTYEEVLTFLRKGTSLLKYGRAGAPKVHHFNLSPDDEELLWDSKGGKTRSLPIPWIKRLQRGQETEVFKRLPQPSKSHLSFSILYTDADKKERSLDVISSSAAEFELWFLGIQVVIRYPPREWCEDSSSQGDQNPSAHGFLSQKGLGGAGSTRESEDAWRGNATTVSSSAVSSSIVDQSFLLQPSKQPPLSHKNASHTNASSSATHSTATINAMGASSALGSRRAIGDIYVWGSLSHVMEGDVHTAGITLPSSSSSSSSSPQTQPQSPNSLFVEPMMSWQQSSRPLLVNQTSSLDVVNASMGTRHACLITRGGELYTWGYGKCGTLGQGSQHNASSPKQVIRLRGRGVRSISCSDASTAAIGGDGSLFTWGLNLCGQLGHGHSFPLFEPKLVTSFIKQGLRVVRVSCGPYHTGAVADDGSLFTWGDGSFGKLGHGDTTSASSPRRVEAFDGYQVEQVECGWWHTAAIASSTSLISPSYLSQPSQLYNNGSMGSAQMRAMTGERASASEAGIRLDSSSNLNSAVIRSDSNSDLNSASARWSRPVSSNPSPEKNPSQNPPEKNPSQNLQNPSQNPNQALGQTSRDSSFAAPSSRINQEGLAIGPAATSSTAVVAPLGSMDSSTSPFPAIDSSAALRSLEMERSLRGVNSNLSRPTSAPTTELGGERGMLFTWGGSFSLSEGVGGGGSGGAKVDTHKGCLGTGDKEGRLVPTRVIGELENQVVIQVACGWNLTVALTRRGHVYQMGATGASSMEDVKTGPPAWEGALWPTLVESKDFYSKDSRPLVIEEVSCGMHHVAAVASLPSTTSTFTSTTTSQPGRPPSDEPGRRVRLLTWGQGQKGQLGNEGLKDRMVPQPVPTIEGKKVLQVSCGGHHTLVVCEHDPRDARSTNNPLSLSTSNLPPHSPLSLSPSYGSGSDRGVPITASSRQGINNYGSLATTSTTSSVGTLGRSLVADVASSIGRAAGWSGLTSSSLNSSDYSSAANASAAMAAAKKKSNLSSSSAVSTGPGRVVHVAPNIHARQSTTVGPGGVYRGLARKSDTGDDRAAFGPFSNMRSSDRALPTSKFTPPPGLPLGSTAAAMALTTRGSGQYGTSPGGGRSASFATMPLPPALLVASWSDEDPYASTTQNDLSLIDAKGGGQIGSLDKQQSEEAATLVEDIEIIEGMMGGGDGGVELHSSSGAAFGSRSITLDAHEPAPLVPSAPQTGRPPALHTEEEVASLPDLTFSLISPSLPPSSSLHHPNPIRPTAADSISSADNSASTGGLATSTAAIGGSIASSSILHPPDVAATSSQKRVRQIRKTRVSHPHDRVLEDSSVSVFPLRAGLQSEASPSTVDGNGGDASVLPSPSLQEKSRPTSPSSTTATSRALRSVSSEKSKSLRNGLGGVDSPPHSPQHRAIREELYMTERQGSSEAVLRTSFADGIPDPWVTMKKANQLTTSGGGAGGGGASGGGDVSFVHRSSADGAGIPDVFASSIAAALAAAAAAAAWDLPSGSMPGHLRELHVNPAYYLSRQSSARPSLDGGGILIPLSNQIGGINNGFSNQLDDQLSPLPSGVTLSASFHRRHQHHRHSSSLAFVPEEGICISGLQDGPDLTPVSSAMFGSRIQDHPLPEEAEEGKEEEEEEEGAVVDDSSEVARVKLMSGLEGQGRGLGNSHAPISAVSAALGRYGKLDQGTPSSSGGHDHPCGSSPSSSVNQPSPSPSLSPSLTPSAWISASAAAFSPPNSAPNSSYQNGEGGSVGIIASSAAAATGKVRGSESREAAGADADAEKLRLSRENMKLSSQVAALERQVAVLMSLQTREMAIQAASQASIQAASQASIQAASQASIQAASSSSSPRFASRRGEPSELEALMAAAAAAAVQGASHKHMHDASSPLYGSSVDSGSATTPVRPASTSMHQALGDEGSTPPHPHPHHPLPHDTVIKGLPSPSFSGAASASKRNHRRTISIGNDPTSHYFASPLSTNHTRQLPPPPAPHVWGGGGGGDESGSVRGGEGSSGASISSLKPTTSMLLSTFNVLDPEETDRLQHLLDEQDMALIQRESMARGEGRLTAVIEDEALNN